MDFPAEFPSLRKQRREVNPDLLKDRLYAQSAAYEVGPGKHGVVLELFEFSA